MRKTTNRDSTRAICVHCQGVIELAMPVMGRPRWTWVHLPHAHVPCDLRALPAGGTIVPADNPVLAGPLPQDMLDEWCCEAVQPEETVSERPPWAKPLGIPCPICNAPAETPCDGQTMTQALEGQGYHAGRITDAYLTREPLRPQPEETPDVVREQTELPPNPR